MRKVDEEVLVSWVNAMLGEIGRVRVVEKVIEGHDDGVGEDGREGEVARCVGCSVDADGYKSCEESGRSKEDEGERPAQVSMSGAVEV